MAWLPCMCEDMRRNTLCGRTGVCGWECARVWQSRNYWIALVTYATCTRHPRDASTPASIVTKRNEGWRNLTNFCWYSFDALNCFCRILIKSLYVLSEEMGALFLLITHLQILCFYFNFLWPYFVFFLFFLLPFFIFVVNLPILLWQNDGWTITVSSPGFCYTAVEFLCFLCYFIKNIFLKVFSQHRFLHQFAANTFTTNFCLRSLKIPLCKVLNSRKTTTNNSAVAKKWF